MTAPELSHLYSHSIDPNPAALNHPLGPPKCQCQAARTSESVPPQSPCRCQQAARTSETAVLEMHRLADENHSVTTSMRKMEANLK